MAYYIFQIYSCRIFVEPTLHVLIAAAMLLVTRKELSLNRRLYAWLLGVDKGGQASPGFFKLYAKVSTVIAVKVRIFSRKFDL